MKKIKYLMPILGLSSIAAIAMPLTSCGQTQQFTVKFDTQEGSTIADVKVNKDSTVTKPTDPTKEGYIFGGWYTDKECTKEFDFSTKITGDITLYAKWVANKLTQEEWNNAWSAIANPRDESRNFTMEGNLLEGVYKFNVKSAGTLNDGHFIHSEGNEEEDDPYLSCIHNDIIWIQTDRELQPYYSNANAQDMIGYFVLIGNIFKNAYNNAKFTDAQHCDIEFSYEWLVTTKIKGKLEFDSNKCVTKIDLTGSAGGMDYPALITIGNYGTTNIDWTIEEKFNFTDHEITAVRTGDDFVGTKTNPITTEEDYPGDAYLFNMPDDLELTGLKYLKVGNGVECGNNIELILNGKVLEEDTDYTVSSKTEVILTNPLTKGDKLRFIFNPVGTKPYTPKVTLTATE